MEAYINCDNKEESALSIFKRLIEEVGGVLYLRLNCTDDGVSDYIGCANKEESTESIFKRLIDVENGTLYLRTTT
jgi:hypothetical protein